MYYLALTRPSSLVAICLVFSHFGYDSVQSQDVQNVTDLCKAGAENSSQILFPCANDKCVDISLLCNNIDDCGDNSDELLCSRSSCHVGWPFYHFQCVSDGKCILPIYQCDEHRDCSDGSDEHGCSSACYFRCLDHGQICLQEDKVCDGVSHCLDGSDEMIKGKCGICNGNQFQLPTGECVRYFCDASQFQCKTSGECVALTSVCDSYNDCIDASDEDDCWTITSLGVPISVATALVFVALLLMVVIAFSLRFRWRRQRRSVGTSREMVLTPSPRVIPPEPSMMQPPSYAEVVSECEVESAQPPPSYDEAVREN